MAKEKEEKIEGKIQKSKTDNTGSASYGAKDIYVLEGLDPVRKRPGMYIGSTGVDGLHHLIWEVVDNCIDEAMAGYAKNIKVELLPQDRIAITDDGRGIPVDIHPQTKKSALETVLCTLHAGGKFGGDSYKVSGGLHGVGVSVVNALSTWVRVEVRRQGAVYFQEYKKGKPITKVEKKGVAKDTGTKVIFSPDPEIFQTIEFDLKKILSHLRQQAYLTKGVKVEVIDSRAEKKPPFHYGFYFDGGLMSFIRHLLGEDKVIQDNVFYTDKSSENVDVETAFVYTEDTESKEVSFANNIYTMDGGMHLTGFRTALTRTLNDYARTEGYIKDSDDNLTGDDVREGLTALIAVKIREPQFEGQTKARLGNPEARTAVDTVISEALKEFLAKNSGDAKRIIEKNLLAAKARKAAKAAKDTVLRKGALEGLTLPGKLSDCSSKHPEESELFIVEGDSAGGSAKGGRDRRTQAILPLRGKILNVEKSRMDKMLANNEIRSLVVALGTAIAEQFDIEKLRYHKIVIMTDADTDGAHIRTLLMTLFYRYFRPIVEGGFLYIAYPPLFRLQSGKDVRYAYSDNEKEKIIAEFQKTKSDRATAKAKEALKDQKDDAEVSAEESADESGEKVKGVNIQRYKGLGEMNPVQLWETTMNPVTRLLKQVDIDDAEEVDRLFDVLMGEVVEPRKNFIQSYAATVKNLDI